MKFKNLIREIPDFPELGVSFKDISPLLASYDGFLMAVNTMTKSFLGTGVTKVAALDARGFLFAPTIANELESGIVMIRKVGKLPGNTHSHDYTLEYGTNTLEIQESVLNMTDKVLIVDDIIATGGSMEAAIRLIQKTGATVVGVSTLIGLKYLGDYEINLKKLIPTAKIHTSIIYQ